jgi:branched-chain amino acid transport system permease protein
MQAIETRPSTQSPWVDWTARERAARRLEIARRLNLMGHPLRWVLALVLAVLWIAVPLLAGGFALKLCVYAGISAIAAIGLNLLSGNAGQVSLGHPFFIGVGVYTAAVVGGDWGAPLFVWLATCALLGAVIGAAIGPFALRLKGNYLVMVTLALVFVGSHVFNNWNAVTGGPGGRAVAPVLQVFGWDLADAQWKDRRFAWFVWGMVAVVALATFNLLRSRVGRALQAIRDREMTAEVLGIALARCKVTAFAISGGLAALAGGLYGAYVGFASPTEWTLLLAIQYLAMIVVGGVGSVLGSIVGAIVIVSLPHVVEAGLEVLPVMGHVISRSPGDGGLVSIFALNQILFGVLIAVFLTAAPRGLAAPLRAAWQRLERRFAP